MAPTATTTKKATASKPKSSQPSYQDMITDAIVNLKERNGSSRQALKKYVKANNNLNVSSDKMFDSLFNKALKNGVDKGVFEQPKGPSGGTKLAKKKAPEKKPAAKKETTAKKPAAKKATATTTAKKPAAKKDAAATTKKATTAKKAAPAKAEKPDTVLTKTKSGRVAKTQKPAATKKAAPKKAAPKKAAAAKA